MSNDRFDNLSADGWEREGYLSIARIVLAVGCVVVAYFEPRYLGSRVSLSWLLILAFLSYSILNYALVEVGKPRGALLLVVLQAVSVVLVSLISAITGGTHSPFLGLYLFVIFSAAYRWGLKGSVLTAGACSVLLCLESIASGSTNHTRFLTGGSVVVVLCFGLLLASSFIGYLMEDEKRRRRGAFVIRRLLGYASPECGVKEAIDRTLSAIRAHFDADQIKLALQETEGDKAFLWEVRRSHVTTDEPVRFSKLASVERKAYFAYPMSAQNRKIDTSPSLALLPSGPLFGPSEPRLAPCHMQLVSERHAVSLRFASLLAVSFSLRGEWLGRLVVCNPRESANHRRDSGFLEALVREVGPVIYNTYLLKRLRSRAQAAERTRIAQELHDGTIQSLIGMEMIIDVARRQATTDPSILLKEVGVVRELLEKEIEELRLKMLEIKPLEIEPARLLNWMAETVAKFGQDFGISASFMSPPQQVYLPPGVCSELASILREALVNVRKHSRANHVVVRFGRENGYWTLLVQDDGRGFEFTGRLTLQELDAAGRGPLIIKERVRMIGGELALESLPGSGARLEISVPHMVYG